MSHFILFASPWWVNLLIFIPVLVFFWIRKSPPFFTNRQLILAAIISVAFGFIEASIVIYLRAALGVLPGYQMLQIIGTLPKSLLSIEVGREAATLVILVSVAFLAFKPAKERLIIFFWMFALWDIFFYVFMWLLIRWPYSLLTTDILFLIPAPWMAQVWYPLLVSGLTALVIVIFRRTN